MIHKNCKVELRQNKSCFLVALGDVHWNADECDRKHFKETIAFCKRMLARGHTVLGLGFGDYNDSMSTSERKATRDLHDFTLDRFDEWAESISVMFYKEALKPLEGKFVGLLEGHHYMRFQSGNDKYKRWYGATNTKYLCELLKATYLGTCGYVTLDFGNAKFNILCHHGRGAAQTRSARIMKRKRFGEGFPEADAVMVGHDHDLFIEPDQGIGINSNGMYQKTRYYVGTGSYLRGYLLARERGTYVEEGMMRPGQLGSAAFEIRKDNNKLNVSPILL